MKILIGADLVPTQANVNLFKDGEVKTLVGNELFELLQSADHRIFNLEVALADEETPISKCGPALIAPTATIAAYKALGVDCLTIANNHIMDQGTDGFFSTLHTLDESRIAYVGGGENGEAAAEPYVFEVDGKKVGVYACAEHEFSIVDEKNPGANPFDPLESPDHVSHLKARCDYVIVLYHGGKEHYRYPSPGLQKVCRKLVEKGADLVLCQHSHCIGCEEKYQDATIVYGQGNFLFDYSENECWKTSLLIQLDGDFNLSYIPLEKQGNTVRLSQKENARAILEAFQARSEEIKDPQFVQERYAEFAKSMRNFYLLRFSSVNSRSFLFRAINKATGQKLCKWLMKRHYSKRKLLMMRNFIECEAHRELLLSGIGTEE